MQPPTGLLNLCFSVIMCLSPTRNISCLQITLKGRDDGFEIEDCQRVNEDEESKGGFGEIWVDHLSVTSKTPMEQAAVSSDQ